MDWIKAKYDRLLLGLFGVIALLVGGLLVSKVLGFKSNFPKRPDPIVKSNFGTDDAGKKLDAAKALLKEERTVNPPKFKNLPIGLFTSFPVLKKAGDGTLVPVLDPDSEPVRPPIQNKWLYENNLDITRTDIADLDPDGDGYTNTEEFKANPQTNPRDKESTPPFTDKIAYTECVKDPFTIVFRLDGGDQEITIRRTEPANMAFNNLVAVGGEFPAERGSTVMRFKLTKVDRSGPKPVAIVDDLATKDKVEAIKLVKEEPFAMPGRRAKLVCSLGAPEEKVVSDGEEFEFMAKPEIKFTVKKITDDEVTLEFTPPGETAAKTMTFKIPTPP